MRRWAGRPRPHPLLAVAVAIALLFHGALLVGGSYRGTFDAYVHIFFADHYARTWYDNWEPRWYTGFTVTSYPPGAHQLVALASAVLGLEGAFVAVQLGAVVLLVIGVYRFSRLWVDPRAAGMAALLAATGPGIAEAVHVFGQLPTTLSLAFLLNAMPSIRTWLVGGRAAALATALAAMAATTAVHHVTTLFGAVFFAGPVIVAAAADTFRRPTRDEERARTWRLSRATLLPLVARRLRRVLPFGVRLAVFGAGTVVLLVVVDLAYWLWTSSDPIAQIPIPHASRDSFLVNVDAGLLFFVLPWGAALFAIPYVLIRGFGGRAWPLALSAAVLFVLGTGGTTPFPKLLLRGAYDILTLDRFTFWGTIAVLPFAGRAAWSLFAGGAGRTLDAHVGGVAARTLRAALAGLWIFVTVVVVTLPATHRMQPATVDMRPIVDFLDKDEHWRYRYLTLGLGDQMAWLSAQTRATTVDGNYHSARRLPALTTTPIERLDGAKFQGVPGLGSLQQFLAEPERYRLKFVFSNDRFYDPLLAFSGWNRVGVLENAVVVWERADIPPLPEELPARRIPLGQRILWGTLPPLSIGAALVLLGLGATRRFAPIPRRRLGLLSGDVRRRPWRWIDAGLRAAARTAGESGEPGESRPARWQPWTGISRRGPRLRVPSAATRGTRGRAVLAGLALVAAVAGLGLRVETPPPGQVVSTYFEDLDLRRYDEAYALLDPVTRPSFEQYRLLLSVRGGLLGDAFAKLQHADVRVALQGSGAVADVELTWTTSLSTYRSTERVTLVRRDAAWRIVPELGEAPSPGDQLVAVRGVSWDLRGRRGVTDQVTASRDVLDRPDLRVLSAATTMIDDRVVVIGEVESTGTTPADLTVTARLRDATGVLLAEANASDLVDHLLLPGQRTAFRIDFEAIAGAGTLDPSATTFRPGADTPHRTDLAVRAASMELAVRAVVTNAAGATPLAVSGARVRATDGSCRLGLALTNMGAATIAVPRVLIAGYGPDGRLARVDAAYLPYGILPGRVVDADVPQAVSAMRYLALPVGISVNGLPAIVEARPATADALTVPPRCGNGTLRVTVAGYAVAP